MRGVPVEGATPALWPGVAGGDLFPDDAGTVPEGAVELDEAGYEALRIAAGVPRMGARAASLAWFGAAG